MILDVEMKRSLDTGLSRDPGSAGAAEVARFLAGLPNGIGVKESFHWSEALVIIRHLCFSREHSAASMRVLDVVRERSFGSAVENAGGPAAGEWTSILERVRATRLDRKDILIVHEAYVATMPGYGERVIASGDLDAVTEPLLIGAEDRQALISHGADAIERGRALRVDQDSVVDGDIEPSRREKGVWQAFDAFAEADPKIDCLADLLRPGYPEQRPGYIGGSPVTADMLEEAAASLGARYRSASPEAEAAQTVLDKLHRASAERSLGELVTRHTRHVIVSGGDAAATLQRIRATGGEYDAAAGVAQSRRRLLLPEKLGHVGELEAPEQSGTAVPKQASDADGGKVGEKVAVRTLGAVCGVFTFIYLFQGFGAFIGALLATVFAVVSFQWFARTRYYAGATFGLVIFASFWSSSGGFFSALGTIALIALLVGSIAKFIVRMKNDGSEAEEVSA